MQEYAVLSPQSQPKKAPKPRRMTTRYTNRTKVLLCYVAAWGLALALPTAGLLLLFPYTLVGTAPSVLENLSAALPGIAPRLEGLVRLTTLSQGMSAQALAHTLALRDQQWCLFVGGLQVFVWLASLLVQLGWRSLYRHPLHAARTACRAVRTYRLTLLGIFLLNALGGLAVYWLGLQFVAGKTAWDWLLTLNGFALTVLAAFLCFRLAAPPALSGKHSFFKRL